MQAKFPWVLCLIGSAAMAACGGDDTPSIAIADYAEALHDASCARRVQCGDFPDDATCKRVLRPPALASFLAGVDSGALRYDGVAALACVEATQAASCDQSSESVRVRSDACRAVFKGSVEDGGACAVSEQCVSGFCNVPACSDECCAGACEPVRAAGQPCVAGQCDTGLFCNAAADDTCTPLLSRDATCTANAQCGFGLLCITGEGGARTCQPTPLEGDPCLNRTCNPIGLGCNITTNTCERVLFDDATCDPSTTRCSLAYLRCDTDTLTCVTFPAPGEACNAGRCVAGAFCDRDPENPADLGTCTAQRALGEPCASNGQCQTNACSASGTCQAAPICI